MNDATLLFAANATAAVNSFGGWQFVVVTAEGSKGRANDPKGAMYIASALRSPLAIRARTPIDNWRASGNSLSDLESFANIVQSGLRKFAEPHGQLAAVESCNLVA